jgi:hypothetical protein
VGAIFSVGLYVLAVAAQRRSCFVHVLVSVTARHAIAFASDSAAVCVPLFCRTLRVAAPRVVSRSIFEHVLLSVAVLRAIAFAGETVAMWVPSFLSDAWLLHARSYSTIGGGTGNAASGRRVLAVAAQRRSCFVHVLVSVTARPCECVRSLSPVTVWPCVCH